MDECLLRIIILDSDVAYAAALKALAELKVDVEEVRAISLIRSADYAFRHEGFNSLFIDPFSIGVHLAIPFIERVRKCYPRIPICLYAPPSHLDHMLDVPDAWRERFGHYHKLHKDESIAALSQHLEHLLPYMLIYYQRVPGVGSSSGD